MGSHQATTKMIAAIGSLVGRPWIICSAILVIAIGYYGQPILNDTIDHYKEYVKVEAKETTVTEVKAEAEKQRKAESDAKAEAEVKAEAEEQAKAEAEAKAKADTEAKAEAEAKA